jgi:Domain of Unknown Function (DUF748)
LKKLLKNPISWLTLILLLYTLVGFFIGPVVIKNQIVDLVKDQLKREAKVESVSFNPFTFDLSIENFSLLDKDSSVFLSLKELYADINVLPIINGRIELENITVTNPVVTIKKLTESEFNFSDLIKTREIPKDSSWEILIKKLVVQNSNLIFKDYSVNPAVEIFIDSANVELTNIHPLSTDTTDFKAELQIRSGGNITVNGMLTLQPLTSVLHYDVKGLALNALNQYVSQFAKLNLNNGSVSTSGDVKVSIQDASKLPIVNYNGNFRIDQLSLLDSENQHVADCKTIRIDDIAVVTSPFSVIVRDIILNQFFASVVLDTSIKIIEGLRSIPSMVEQLKTEISDITNTPKEDFHIDIGEIKIENSELVLSDFSLPQKFTVDIHSLNGDISGFSSDKPLSTTLLAEGIVGKDGKAQIDGKIDLLDPLAFAILKLNFKNIDLRNFTPYTMKFLGYKVEKGKLSLDLNYQITNENLISDNKIYLNQLTLGEKVEQTEAMDLPVELALALLKDKDGNIDMDVEVTGNLNDPDIDVGALVWWAVKRSFTKVIEAPFIYLGELIGIDGADLEYISFNPGESTLLPDEKEKLAHINTTFNERQEITLEVYGAVDPITDAKIIRSKKFNAAYLKRTASVVTDSLMTLQNADADNDRNILELMYFETFGKDKLDELQAKYFPQVNQTDSSSLNKSYNEDYLTEMIKSLEDEQQVSEAEIISLANERADAIKNYLLTLPNITPERLVMKEVEIYEQKDQKLIKCKLGIGSI